MPTGLLVGRQKLDPDRPGGNTRCRKTERNDMLRRLGIRAKVMAVLAVPMLALFGAGVYISLSAVNDYRYAAASRGAIDSGHHLIDFTDALMLERVAALTGASEEDYQAAQAVTDGAYAQWAETVAGVDESLFPPSVTKVLNDALTEGKNKTAYA